MASIERNGVPNSKTEGALGDIYTDLKTGKRYKCTGAYGVRTHAEHRAEFEWTLMEEEPAARPMNKPNGKPKPVVEPNKPSVKTDNEPKPARQNYGEKYQKARQ